MRFGIDRLALERSARLAYRLFELSQSEKRSAQLEVSLRKRRASLLDCRANRLNRAGQVSLLDKHPPQFELSIGIIAVPLLERLAKGSSSLFQVTASGERHAEVVPCFWKIAVPLLDRAVERIDGFTEIAAP